MTKKTSSGKTKRRFDLSELRAKLRIDKHNLDEEVEQQADLYFEIAEAAILAKSRYHAADEELKQVEADVDLKIRKRADKNDERITEKGILREIARSREYIEASRLSLVAREEYERLDALQTSFRQRSSMLRDLVELHVAGYFTSRSVRGSANRREDQEVGRIRRRLDDRREGKFRSRKRGQRE